MQPHVRKPSLKRCQLRRTDVSLLVPPAPAPPFGDEKAVAAGHLIVDKNDIGTLCAGNTLTLHAVGRHRRPAPRTFQVHRHQVNEVLVVINDPYMTLGFHAEPRQDFVIDKGP